jgi:hypothetical protein
MAGSVSKLILAKTADRKAGLKASLKGLGINPAKGKHVPGRLHPLIFRIVTPVLEGTDLQQGVVFRIFNHENAQRLLHLLSPYFPSGAGPAPGTLSV